MYIYLTLSRALAYLFLLPTMFYANRTGIVLLQSLVSGIMFADLLTWIIFAIIEVPKNALGNIFSLLINIAAIYCAIFLIEIEMPKDIEGEAVCFLSFIATIGLKTGWRMLKKIHTEE